MRDSISFINEQLLARGITQAKFAEMCNLTEVSMSRYLNYKREPKVSVFIRMLNALGYQLYIGERICMRDGK